MSTFAAMLVMMIRFWRIEFIRLRLPLLCIAAGIKLGFFGLLLAFLEIKVLKIEKHMPILVSQSLMAFDLFFLFAGQAYVVLGLLFLAFVPAKVRWEIEQQL